MSFRNNSTNFTQIYASDASCDVLWSYKYWFYTFTVLSITSLIGNGLIMAVVYRSPRLRTTHNFIVVNMAASDILIPPLDLTYYIAFHYKDVESISDTTLLFLCKFVAFFSNVSVAVTSLSHLVLCAHRFYAVFYPMKARLEEKCMRKLTVMCIWFVSMLLASPILYFNRLGSNCYNSMDNGNKQAFWIIFSVATVALPSFIMTTLYTKVIRKLKSQKPLGISFRQEIKRKQRNMRLAKLFITLLSVFFALYGSYWIVSLIGRLASEKPWPCPIETAYLATYPFVPLCSSINPVISFSYSKRYRQGL